MPRTLIAVLFRRLSREDPWALAAFAATASLGVVVLFNTFPLYALLAAGTEMADGRRAQVDLARMGLELTRQEANAHAEFHTLRDFSPAMFLLGVLLPFFAWYPIREGRAWAFLALLIGGLAAFPGPLLAIALFGPAHGIPLYSYVWAASAALTGVVVLRRRKAAGSSPGRPTST